MAAASPLFASLSESLARIGRAGDAEALSPVLAKVLDSRIAELRAGG
jgi:hypothetical protein